MAIDIKNKTGELLKTIDAADLQGADLRDADLQGADLRDAYLGGAYLRGAVLQGADLQGAVLQGAYLRGAYLRDANLRDADLRDANLQGANLRDANLEGANLRGANLRDSNLRDANLRDAVLPHFQICPVKGYFRAFKRVKTIEGTAVIEIEIAASSPRTSSLVGRKCRAQRVRVIPGQLTAPAYSLHDPDFIYPISGEVSVTDYDGDIRIECTRGIHFFMTRKEAEEY